MKFKRTLQFYRWFNKSQVLAPGGDPLVVYHGTASVFNKFGTGRGAIYFTSDPEIASIYAEYSDATDEDGECITGTVEPVPNVIPAFLSIRKPLILDEKWARKNLGEPGYDRDWVDFDSLIYSANVDQGYDGVILRGVIDFAGMNDPGERIFKAYDQYIVFDPKQIKSAIGNSGLYDINSASIADHPDEQEEEKEVERERLAA